MAKLAQKISMGIVVEQILADRISKIKIMGYFNNFPILGAKCGQEISRVSGQGIGPSLPAMALSQHWPT